ncbi:Zn-dependent hydrolase [Thalassobaculum sp.]|uniref:Zn-dependent hydrolase n=1 Tax=Thalassobaculum sp. TaxID=2022740 RepID=UPI003B5B59C9
MADSQAGFDIPPLKADLSRLKADVEAVNALGIQPGLPGINRVSFSDADMAGRRWLMTRMADAGLAVWMDCVGNVFGRWEVGDGPAVMVGSHLDTVVMGGPLDGTLGVCAGLEAVRSMQDAGLTPRRPVVVVATADEEGRFGGMLGSQAICGEVGPDWIAQATDSDGTRLADALTGQGLDPTGDTAWRPESIAAFLELHIEQGPVLDRAGEAIGLVDAVSGVFNWSVTLTGEANHSGTTPMDHRRDAFRGMADFGHAIDRILAEAGGPQSRLTVGKAALSPNFPHSVAGTASFSIIGRDADDAVMEALAEACRTRLSEAAERHGLELDIVRHSWLPPTRLDTDLHARLCRHADALGAPYRTMPSGAGHDAQTFARHVPAGLIFVPSVGGISHAPNEHSDWDSIHPGATLLARAVADLAV